MARQKMDKIKKNIDSIKFNKEKNTQNKIHPRALLEDNKKNTLKIELLKQKLKQSNHLLETSN